MEGVPSYRRPAAWGAYGVRRQNHSLHPQHTTAYA